MRRRRPRRRLVLLGLATAPLAAAAPWSAPRDVSRPHTFIDDVSIAFVPSGAGLIGWRLQDGVGAGARGGEAVAARSASGALGPARSAPRGRSGRLVLYGRSRAAVALVRPVGSNRDPRSELRVAFGSAGGALPAVEARRPPPADRAAELRRQRARRPRARVVRGPRAANDRVEVALRRAGGSFGAPLRLATGRVRSVSVAVGPRGDVLVAWDARGKIRTRLRRAGRRTLRAAPRRCAPRRRSPRRCAPRSRAPGRAYVAWAAQLADEGGDTGPAFYEAAVRPAGAARFRPAQLLERLGAGAQVGPLDLALTGHGNAVVAWTGERVRAAQTDASGRFGAPADLSLRPGCSLPLTDVAAAPDGARVAVWTAGSLVQAAYAAPGAPFGPPEDVGSRRRRPRGVPARGRAARRRVARAARRRHLVQESARSG